MLRVTYRSFAFLSILLAGLSGRAAAQQALPVQMDLDYAAFAYEQDRSLVELYMAFEVTSLVYERAGDGFQAMLPLELKVVRSSTQAALPGTPADPVWQDAPTLSFVVTDTSALSAGKYFIHQLRAALPPGEYELHVKVPRDAERGRQELELRRDLRVPGFGQTELVGLSDVTLATAIQPSEDREDPFYKNGLLIRSSANQLFGQGLDRLFYYAEAYHVDQIAGDDGKYSVYAYIAEANRPQPVGELERRFEREARSPDVLVGQFDLSALPSGSYFLRVVLLDDRNEARAEQSRKFFVYNPKVERQEPALVEQTFETSMYASMSEEEVERSLEHLSLMATDGERRRIRGIRDLDEKRRFMMEFWEKRDPTPGTPTNEFQDEFYRRLQYVNERYANSYSEGWKTERGRVFVKYGPPAHIEPHLYDRETAPYEIWQYNNIPGEGQAVFIFADRSGFGQFDLIHSSVTGERKSPDWQMELRR